MTATNTAANFSNDVKPVLSYPSPSSRNHIAPINHPGLNVTGISDNQAALALEKGKMQRNFWQVQKDRFDTLVAWANAGIAKESFEQSKQKLNQAIVGTHISRMNTASKEWELVTSKAGVEKSKLNAQNATDEVFIGQKRLTLNRMALIASLQDQEFKVSKQLADLDTTKQITQMQGNARDLVTVPKSMPEIERMRVSL
jgi:hypothetical protein